MISLRNGNCTRDKPNGSFANLCTDNCPLKRNSVGNNLFKHSRKAKILRFGDFFQSGFNHDKQRFQIFVHKLRETVSKISKCKVENQNNDERTEKTTANRSMYPKLSTLTTYSTFSRLMRVQRTFRHFAYEQKAYLLIFCST